jgi:hypothetical protein
MWKWQPFSHWWLKIIKVGAGQRTSLQYHRRRSEVHIGLTHWQFEYVPTETVHRLKAGLYLELAWGLRVVENDIVRLSDDYGR